MPEKKRVVFVGAFRDASDGTMGGQLHACRTLIDSPLGEKVDFTFLDSTQKSLPPPPFPVRFVYAMGRLGRFVILMFKPGIQSVLIFSSAGFSFLEKGGMVMIARACWKRVILCPRSGLIENDVERSAFMRSFIRFTLFCTTHVVCQSERWRDFYARFCSRSDKLVVIRNWLDPAPYLELPEKENSDGGGQVLFMGWLERNKGIYELWEAWQALAPQFPDSRLFLCGMGGEYAKLKGLVDESPLSSRVDFTGWVKGAEKLEMLGNADVFVIPSYREGLPNALLEAMAAGRAVISTRVGAIPDVLNGENGILVDPGDVSSLRESLKTVMEDHEKRRSMGRAARATVRTEHDIGKIWNRVYQLL